MEKNYLLPNPGNILSLVITSSLCLAISMNTQAAEKNYNRPPFTAFSSQMRDGLTGGSKYEKPVWNLHDALKLPNWLTVSLEQRTRYEMLDGTFKAGSNGGDQQIALQTNLFLEANFTRGCCHFVING